VNNHMLQSLRQSGATTRPQLITTILKTLLVLFGVLVVLSYGYILFGRPRPNMAPSTKVIQPVIVIVPLVLGWLIDRKHPGHTIAFLFLVMAYSSAVLVIVEGRGLFNELLPPRFSPEFNSVILVLGQTMWQPGVFIPLFLIPLYFPDGKLLSQRWRPLVVVIVILLLWGLIAVTLRPWPAPHLGVEQTRTPNGISGSEPFIDTANVFFTALSVPVVPLVCLAIYLRLRRSSGHERMQMKWPIFTSACVIVLAGIVWTIPALSAFDQLSGYMITWSLAMMIPISAGIAILSHRLWDIDIIISRTLIYGGLSALVVAIYAAIVGLFGHLFTTRSNAYSGLIAAVIIAILFQPLRDHLQRQVNRLMYGQRDDPAAVLTQLAEQLKTAGTTTEILHNLVQTIAQTLKIPHVAIRLRADVGRMEPAAIWGEATENRLLIPLTYHQETIGHLVVALRSPKEQFSQQEQDLLATIAAMTTTTVLAVQLSDELLQSRQRIVTTREDERRRLRRDLHDGLGPQLASQTLGLEAASQLMTTNPEKAQVLLDSLKAQAEEAILDVRRIVYNLRPPALDDLGLVGALRQRASRLESGRLRFNLDLPATLPELPAAVEAAVYHIIQEAMTNVVRHADATSCMVRLFVADSQVIFEVRDNGRGLPWDYQSGVGALAMQERTIELNGHFMAESLPGGGTLVRAKLPMGVPGE
jgi:signal transduction histidine kinase